MKVFVTGVGGQLGYDVMRELQRRGHEAVGADILAAADVQLDITDEAAVGRVLQEIQPDAVIHCAAWTAVDAAEDAENKEKVYAVNVTGTKNLADACRALGCKMMYISTDYVFNGQGEAPWTADCKDFAPLNHYGQTKLWGEQAVAAALDSFFIVRIAWVFGIHGKNFIKTMLSVGKKYDTVRVVSDQIGTPTYTFDLARLLTDMIETERYGFYHATNEGGYISWYDFCREFYRQADAGAPGHHRRIRTEQGGASVQQPPGQEQTDRNGFYTAARLAGRGEAIFIGVREN